MKTQMKFQKWICLSLIILGALAIVYGLLWKTGMLAALGTLCDKVNGTTMSGFTEAEIFYDSDPVNTALFWLGIVSLLSACLLYVFANHKRRNYYATNYVVSVFCAVVNFGVAIVTIIFNAIYMGRLSDIKADTAFMNSWKNVVETDRYQGEVAYSESCGMFVFGYIVCALLIISAVFLILNMLWKRKLMQGEKKLLESSSFAGEVA